MKKLFFVVVMMLLINMNQMNAQSEQSYKPFVLQLTEKGQLKNYVLENFSYSLSRMNNDTIPLGNQSQYVSMNITINGQVDKVIIEWMADPAVSKDGKVLVKDQKTGETIREFAFGDGYLENMSESFYAGYTEGSTGSVNFSVSCKKFSINNVTIKNLKRYYSY